jgi:hypothetical protein
MDFTAFLLLKLLSGTAKKLPASRPVVKKSWFSTELFSLRAPPGLGLKISGAARMVGENALPAGSASLQKAS